MKGFLITMIEKATVINHNTITTAFKQALIPESHSMNVHKGTPGYSVQSYRIVKREGEAHPNQTSVDAKVINLEDRSRPLPGGYVIVEF
ncbi:hypothetical protein ACLB2K_014619 [Fragaria x ananassa]